MSITQVPLSIVAMVYQGEGAIQQRLSTIISYHEDSWKLGLFTRLFPHRAFFKNVKRVHNFIDQHVERAMGLHNVSNGKPEAGNCEGDRRVFLSELSQFTNDRQFLCDEILTTFFAAFDLVAAILTNLFFVLARKPDVWELVREEVGPLDGKKPDISQLRSIQYLRFCLKECESLSLDFMIDNNG